MAVALSQQAVLDMSASVGTLPPVYHNHRHVRGSHLTKDEKDDPVQAVLNRAWTRLVLKDGAADSLSVARGLHVRIPPLADGAAPCNVVAASPLSSACNYHQIHDRPVSVADQVFDPQQNHGEASPPPNRGERKVVRRALARTHSGLSAADDPGQRQSALVSDPRGRKPVGDGYSACDPASPAPNAMSFDESSLKPGVSRRHTTSATSHTADKALHLPRRRYTLDLSAPLDDVDSPKLLLLPECARGGSFRRLLLDDPVAQSLMHGTALPSEDGELRDKSAVFIGLAHGLPASIGQASMRMNDLLAAIRQRLQDSPQFLENDANYERLVDIDFMLATANYHLAKWVHQLDHHASKPEKPRKSSARSEPAPERLLAQVQSAVSRMDLLSSTLTQLLQQVIADARAMRRRAADPVSPTFRNPARVAMRRGLLDIEELQRLPPHLEHLLWVTGNLSNSHAKQTFKQAGTVMQAAVKFRRGLRRSLPERRHTAEGIVQTPPGERSTDVNQDESATIS